MTPPFFTASFSRAKAAVVPWAPQLLQAHAPPGCGPPLSPMAGVGARDKSTMPKGTPRRRLASWATSWPMRVILKAVRLMSLGHLGRGCRPRHAF